MRIRDVFATRIQERIEPVVKVADRRPTVLLSELQNLVVTPQWEQHLRRILDAYTDAAERPDEQSIGIWISGFFGSGKSLLMKVLGALLEGGELEGQPVHQTFLSRVPETSAERADLRRYLAVCDRKMTTTAVGGNLHAMQATREDALALITFRLFALQQGYTHHWPLAWAVEYHIDARGLSAEFRRRASELCRQPWEEITGDPEFYLEQLYEAAAATLPDHFRGGAAAVDRAVGAVQQSGVTPALVVERLRRWCEARDTGGRRHKLLLQLDELGQWIAGGNQTDRIMQVQSLSEEAAVQGGGRIWLAVTAHGDIQALSRNAQQEHYAKIVQRFASQCKLSNDDISLVVEERLLRKTQPARRTLEEVYAQRSGEVTDLGSVQNAQRVYPTPQRDSFALFYPYLPWTVTVIPDVVKGIAQAAQRGEELAGATRTMIGVVQGAIIETPGFLDQSVGRLVSLADLYGQLQSDVAIETKTDLNRVGDSVPQATAFTTRVARALFLLGQAEYIPTTLDNITRALVDSLDANLAALRRDVKAELERLVEAGYAKQVGHTYVFLSTQQRSFQDKVRARQDELLGQTYELIQALKDYEGDDALRVERVPLQDREVVLRLEIDGRAVRNPTAHVTLRVYSPLQRTLDPQIGDDAALRQRSALEPNAILLRLADVPGLRPTLALAKATDEVSNQVISSQQAGGVEVDVARQARQVDLPEHKREVSRLLAQAVRGAVVFFRGSLYQLAQAAGPAEAVRLTLSQIAPNIYSRFADVPHRPANHERAVRAALAHNTTDPDLQALGVYRADGTLSESHALLSTLRGRLPLADDQPPVNAADLRSEFEKPPFGWDGTVVNIGLGLLLRASACRLIENGQRLTDPTSPDVLQLLTKEQRFRNLRVEGVRTSLGPQELMQVRGFMETIFGTGTRLALVPATLHEVLGQKLAELSTQAQEAQRWAVTAQCPLPTEFEAGASLVTELLNLSTPTARLPRLMDTANQLLQYRQRLGEVQTFRREHEAKFLAVRTFFHQIVNAEVDLPAVRRFIQDWRALSQEASVTVPARWNELVPVYEAARQAVTDQAAAWRREAQDKLTRLEADLAQRVRQAGVDEAQVDGEVAALAPVLQEARQRLAQPDMTIAEARGVRMALAGAEMTLHQRLAELQRRYRVQAAPQATETRVTWRDLAGSARISSTDELEQVLAGLRAKIVAELEQHTAVVID